MYKLRELADAFGVNLRSLHNQIARGNLEAFKISPHRWAVRNDHLSQFLIKNPAYHWRLQQNAKTNSSAAQCLDIFRWCHPDRCPIYSREEVVSLLNKPISWYKYRQIDRKYFPARYISQKELVDYLIKDRKTLEELKATKHSLMKYTILRSVQERGIQV